MEDLTPEGSTDPIIVGYISRMVGWYPKTYDVQVGEGVDATVKFTDTDSYAQVIHTDGKTYDCVVFKNKLDGQTDVMMTDMREGRYQLDGFKTMTTTLMCSRMGTCLRIWWMVRMAMNIAIIFRSSITLRQSGFM